MHLQIERLRFNKKIMPPPQNPAFQWIAVLLKMAFQLHRKGDVLLYP
jgi:hypothetical protein